MMILICLSCAVLAVLWAVPAPTSPAAPGSAGASCDHRPLPVATPGRGRFALLVAVCASTVLLAGILLDGARGTVLGLAVVVVGSTVAGLAHRRRRRRTAERSRVEVARSCNVLAAHLRVGQLPGEALALAAVDCPVLRDARDAHQLGGDVPRVWRHQAGTRRARRSAATWLGPGRCRCRRGRRWRARWSRWRPACRRTRACARWWTASCRLRGRPARSWRCSPRAGSGSAICWVATRSTGCSADRSGWGCLLAGVVLACLGVLWIEALAQQATR